ncbi:TPA: hypothetical protein ACKJ8X_001874, partial [Neisseria gonorrhoeae]
QNNLSLMFSKNYKSLGSKGKLEKKCSVCSARNPISNRVCWQITMLLKAGFILKLAFGKDRSF